jgi:hypothetical protein
MPTWGAAPSAPANTASVVLVILAALLVPLACADLLPRGRGVHEWGGLLQRPGILPVRDAFGDEYEARYESAMAVAWAAVVAILSTLVMRLKEQGGVPTAEELAEAEGAVAQVANTARTHTPPPSHRRVKSAGVTQVQGQGRVPVKNHEPWLTATHLAGLQRIAACTQGDDTAGQALEAAEDLLQSAIAAANQHRRLKMGKAKQRRAEAREQQLNTTRAQAEAAREPEKEELKHQKRPPHETSKQVCTPAHTQRSTFVQIHAFHVLRDRMSSRLPLVGTGAEAPATVA